MRTMADHEPGLHGVAPLHVRYFTEFLPTIIGRLLLEDLRELSDCFEIVVTDDAAPPWRLEIEAGRLVHVGHDGPAPACRFSLDAATLAEVVAARRTPADAFFDKRIELEGDVERGLVLSTVLEPFFHRFPFHG
jgi:predicted lipid carrier protein YhbT